MKPKYLIPLSLFFFSCQEEPKAIRESDPLDQTGGTPVYFEHQKSFHEELLEQVEESAEEAILDSIRSKYDSIIGDNETFFIIETVDTIKK